MRSRRLRAAVSSLFLFLLAFTLIHKMHIQPEETKGQKKRDGESERKRERERETERVYTRRATEREGGGKEGALVYNKTD